MTLIFKRSEMPKFNYVVELAQEIHDDEMAIARKRQLLDSAWNALIADGKEVAGTHSTEQPSIASLPGDGHAEKK